MTIDHNLTCAEFQELLSDYFEGTLPDAAVAGAELHIAACISCRALVHDLQSITRDAAALGGLVPSRDLWPGIEARISTTVLPLPVARTTGRRWARWQLGAIAAGLVAVTALSTWKLARYQGTPQTVAQTPVGATDSTPPSTAPAPEIAVAPTTTRPVAAATNVQPVITLPHAKEISDLRSLFDERADELDPTTRAILSNSLRTIDDAIAEARAALSRDPKSQFLTHKLNESLEQKLGLLRKAALLSRT